MGLFRPSRERYGPDPLYEWKVILFSVGAGMGLFGMISNRDWLVLAAIPVLAVGVTLRWFGRRRSADDAQAEPGESPGDESEDSSADEGEPHGQP